MGKQATGQLKSKVETSTKVNKQPVYKLTFEFKTPNGIEHKVTAKTHQPEKLEDDAEEPLLYDPMFPSYAVMLDNLPGSPRIDEGGNIRAGSAFAACLQLVIPVVTMIGHGGYIYLRFLS